MIAHTGIQKLAIDKSSTFLFMASLPHFHLHLVLENTLDALAGIHAAALQTALKEV